MKRSLTKTRFMIMGLLLLLAGGYATGAAYLNSSGFRQKLLLQANAAMDGRLTIHGHYLALHDARLELSGVRLADAQGELLAEIKRLQLRLNWAALFRRTVHIKTLDVQNARFYLDFDPADQLRMIRAKKTSRPPDRVNQNKTVWAWRIDDMRLNQGALSFKRPAKQFEGQLNIRDITAWADSKKPTGRVHIVTGPSQWRQIGTAYELPPLNLSAGVDASQTITLTMKTPMSKMNARGRLDRKPDNSILDVDGDIDLNPAELHAWLPENTEVRDPIRVHVTAKGSLENPIITLHATMSNAMVTGIPIGQLEADLGMHHRNVTVHRLRSRSDWGEIDLTGHINLLSVLNAPFNFAAAQWENLSYQLKLQGKNLQPDRLGRFRFPPGGIFELESDITGNGLASAAAHAKADMAIQVSGLSPRKGAPGISGRLNAEIQRQGAVIDLNRVQAAVGGNNLRSDARIDLDSGRIEQSKTQIQSTRLEELGALLGLQFPSGTGDLNIRCQGPFQHPTAQIDLLTREMSLEHHPLGRFLAEARLDKQGVLNISHMVLENQGSLVEGRGRLTLFGAEGDIQTDPDVRLDVDFQQLTPSDFGLTASAGSHFTGRISLAGTLQHPKGQAVLEESVVHWGDFDGRLKGNARWDDGRLTLTDLQLYKAASVVNVQGSAQWPQTNKNRWSATPHVEARIQGEDIRVQDFFQDHVGILAVEGMVSGPTTDLNGRFSLSGSDLNIGGQPFKSLNIKGRSSSDKIFWDTLEIGVDKDQQLTGQGWYAFDRRFNLNMVAEDIGLRHVTALQKAYPVDGRLDLRLEATGTIDTPQMNADLTIREPRLDDQPWDDFHVSAQMQGRQLELAADLNFDLTGQYLIDSGDFNISADFNRSDVTPYLALWVGADWAGKLSGSVRAKGNRREPEKIEGQIALSDTELRYQNRRIVFASQLKTSLENGRLKLPATRMELLDDGFIQLQADGRLTADLHISSDGRLPLAALTPFVEALEEPRGEVTFEASAQGSLNEMRWQTKLDFNDTGFEIPGLDQQVESLKGHLEISPGRLIVEDLSGRMDGGRFTLNGQMPLAAWQPVGGQLILNAHALPLQWPDTMDVVLSGDLTFKGAKETPDLSGRLIVLEGSYYKDVKLNLLSAVTQKRRAVPVSGTYSVPGQLGRTSLNVAVTHRYPLLVDNNLANLQIAPDLKISGTLARPILSGRAEVTEGEVIFRRKSFEVKRGVVDFINPYKIEPNIDIVAEADIRQWRVSLSLAGPPDQLVFKLNSDPAASENDILSLILLGRTGSELAKGEGGGKQTTRQMLASLVATAWGEDVKKQTGVDILEVETGTGEDQESADRVQLTVGKKLSRRLTLKYEVESGKEELVQRAISEYRFLEHLLASGFQDSKGGYGGELVFRLEF